jgi:hypothetical protein
VAYAADAATSATFSERAEAVIFIDRILLVGADRVAPIAAPYFVQCT